MPGKFWVEVETFRGACADGSNPFFAVETKLRRKLELLSDGEEMWLLVPNDVALLGTRQLRAVACNLSVGGRTVRAGFLDLNQQCPVFLDTNVPAPAAPARVSGASWRTMGRRDQEVSVRWTDVAGYENLKARVMADVLDPIRYPDKYSRYDISPPNSLLLYGLQGCGKSLVGRVLAGEAEVLCRRICPSDVTSMWLGEGVAKIRALFDWAIKQPACLIVLDEIDAVAPVRREHDMHTDEKRQVNELLAQLDRIARHNVSVVGTTNYLSGIDPAIRRSGRFDVKIPVFPPTLGDRREIFQHYLRYKRRSEIRGTSDVDIDALAQRTALYVPADIENIVNTALRRAVLDSDAERVPQISTDALLKMISETQRSVSRTGASQWIREVREESGGSEELEWLEREVQTVFGGQA
jgi:AAA+ superfamily predicted ATPase